MKRELTKAPLAALMGVHGAASLIHFTHNATFLVDYPNMPPSLTAAGVYGVWFAIAAVGLAGYGCFASGRRRTGLALVALFAVLGFGGLDHYVVAPVSAHTLAMNGTIAIEVLTAALLLAAVTVEFVRSRHRA
ncbi:MAG TPA: hypothetical protein VK629_08255 [Steroidobacteraceae bacterium]|nr:hypothetical protein [Steroidobacteraceae bacterium]